MEKELDEALEKTYDELTKPEEVEEVVEETPTEEPVEEIKEDKTEEPVEVEPVEEIPVDEVVEEIVEAVSEAPTHWSGVAKPYWNKLDPVVRAEVLKQVQFADKMQSRIEEERQKGAALDKALENHKHMLVSQYGSVENGLSALLALSDFAQKDPNGFVQHFTQQRGIDLRGLSGMQQGAVDPNVTALNAKIQELSQTVNGFTQRQEQELNTQVDSAFREFSDNPSNKYAGEESIKETMAKILDAGLANDFQSAYEKAILHDPIVSELIASDKRAEADAKRVEEAKKAANKAKEANKLNVSTKGTPSDSPSKHNNWLDTLSETADKAFSA